MSTISQQILQDVEQLPEILQSEILDFVHFLRSKELRNRKLEMNNQVEKHIPNGKKIADILDRMAARGSASSGIADPVEWQREIRKNRCLPSRDA